MFGKISQLLLAQILTLTIYPFFLAADDNDSFLKNSSFSGGPEWVYVDLHNHSTAIAPATKFKGSAWGGTGTYEYKKPNGIYINFNGYFVKGHIHRTHQKRNFSDERLEFRLGHVFVLDCNKKWKLTPYAGFGFGRIVQSHVAPPVPGAPFIKTKTPTYYVPVGAIVSCAVNENFILAASAKWTPQVDATLITSAIKSGRWRLKNRDGWVVEMPTTYHRKICDADASITFAPYWRLLRKGTGTAVNAAGTAIPIAGQRYYFYGLKLVLGVSF